MIFRTWWERAKDALWARWIKWQHPDFISEEQSLQEEFDRLDAEEPGWDREIRVIQARSGLGRGTPRVLLVSIYGEDVVLEAEQPNEPKQKP